LKDGIDVLLELKDDEPINLILPGTVILKVKEAEAVIKGQTATSGLKPAILENNVKIMVPLHIEKGIKVVVKTSDNSYVEKVK
jgi:elongation factor P